MRVHRLAPLTGLALLMAGAALAQTAPPRDARNASFWQRVDLPPADRMLPPKDWYKPLAPLASQPGPFLPAAQPGKTTVPAQALDEAAQYVQASNGQALIVIHKGVVQAERYFGGTDASTQFSSHSFAKTLAAASLGAAVTDGKIASVDLPASRWLPEWRGDAREAITLRQLLTMSGGFRTAPSTDPASRYMQLHYGSDVEEIVRTAPLAYPPGTDFAYDNENLQALGLVIERATGTPYLDYVGQRLWKPLGASGAELLMDREGGRAMPYCCAWSVPRDWARVGQMLLDGGTWRGQRILSEAFVQEMRKPSAANASFGFQLALGSAWLEPRLYRASAAQKASLVPALAPDLFYLSGAGGLQLALIPSEQLLILRVGKPSPAWRDQALPNLLYAALHPERHADWGWLYDWRMANRPDPRSPSLLDLDQPQQWPAERVAGGAATPLPRRVSACLNDTTLAPALAEIQRVKSYSFLVWRDGAVEYEYYASGFGPDTRAEPASMHKSVLGLLVGQAIADGAIPSLQTPVSRWLKEWAGDPRGAITVEQMLQMASGLAPLHFDLTPGSAYSRALYGADSTAVPLAATLADAPGSRFNYASGISQLLGLIIERATGKRYADYLSKRLWQPLGAQDAYVTLDHPGGLARTSSALFARPEDWVRLGLLFVQQGRVDGRQVVDARWVKAMATPSPANPNYGYQLWIASPHAPQRAYNSATKATVPAKAPFLASDMVLFDGSGAQRVYASPAENLVIVRLGAGTFDWDDSLVPNLVTTVARQCRDAR
ncbi:beta-lactamase family protein [Pelomonas sp. P8]|uniref:Beta-lactamase family protein n=2 Tax=Pelomonas cellulosilytica TaxID=2906762 RepID=A0ABS8XJ49_9BURK|nr:beta-lactamase family protein [Pelomonas sp. P8]